MLLFRRRRTLTAVLAGRWTNGPQLRGRNAPRFESRAAHGRARTTRPGAAILAVVLAALYGAPLAFAQTSDSSSTSTPTAHPKKKRTKPAASASASATATDSAAAAPASPPAPEPVPSNSSSASSSVSPPTEAAAATPPPPPPDHYDITNTTEDPGKRYLFVGLRYRGTVVPAFIEHIFVDEGKTIYSNTFGAEFEIRKGGQSMIPWIQYTDYNTGDILFHQKSQPTSDAAFYSDVNSSLKALYIGIDELWSVPVATHLDFEFGFGVGLGFIFGHLQNDWVYQTTNGPLVASNGLRFTECPSTTPPTANAVNGTRGCAVGDHVNATIAKVGGYVEPNWFNGGSVPVIFPHVAVPQLSLRYKPIKQLETRLSIGFSLTGFWFGISADYGLEKKEDQGPASHGATHEVRVRDTL